MKWTSNGAQRGSVSLMIRGPRLSMLYEPLGVPLGTAHPKEWARSTWN
jgi:hypothetical protein